MFWLIRSPNFMTTRYYFDLIVMAVKKAGENIKVIDSLKDIDSPKRGDVFITGSALDTFKLLLKGKKNIVVWIQGVGPEESFMRNKSYFRKIVLECIEKYVLRRVRFALLVSEAMKKHFEIKYDICFDNNYYLMPCFNASLQKESFYEPNKYKNNVFVYAGSLYVWQCFNETADMYKKIESLNKYDTKLLVFTPDIDKALEILKIKNVLNYEVRYVEPIHLAEELSKAKFGFIIRDDNIVNRVATPTKISTYVSNGVIPIFSNCLTDFANVSKNMKYVVKIDDKTKIDSIINKMNENINADDVYEEFYELFSGYYNAERHVEEISKKIAIISH